MADNLFPEGALEEGITAEDLQQEAPIGYRGGAAFDYKTGDFLRDGTGKILSCNGIESWKAWCIHCISTERYAHLGYSTDFGIETGPAFRAETREEAESHLTREITEALLADPYGRTAYVENIVFHWMGSDGVLVQMEIRGIEDVSIDIQAVIQPPGTASGKRI